MIYINLRLLFGANKYSLLNKDDLEEHFQMQLSPKKKKMLSTFFLVFSQFRFNFEHFQKKITLIADVFFDLRTPKNVVR